MCLETASKAMSSSTIVDLLQLGSKPYCPRRPYIIEGCPAICQRSRSSTGKAEIRDLAHIYEVSLDAKFISIMDVIARDLGYGISAIGLTAERRAYVQDVAEQALINWTVARKSRPHTFCSHTNLQHLMDEYCAIAEHL